MKIRKSVNGNEVELKMKKVEMEMKKGIIIRKRVNENKGKV